MPRRMLREDMARLIAYHAIFFDKQGFPFRKICCRPEKPFVYVCVSDRSLIYGLYFILFR